MNIPELEPVDIAAGRALVARVAEDKAIAEVQTELEAADRRSLLRAAAADRRWSPQFRCDRCHSFTASATSACPQCGHVGASNDEGQRTSYARAHARRRARRR